MGTGDSALPVPIVLVSSCTNTNTKRPEKTVDSVLPEAPESPCLPVPPDHGPSGSSDPRPHRSPAEQLPLKSLSAVHTVAGVHTLCPSSQVAVAEPDSEPRGGKAPVSGFWFYFVKAMTSYKLTFSDD